MSERNQLYPGEDSGAFVHFAPDGPDTAPLPAFADPEADPSTDDLLPMLAGLLPLGSAWRTPDGAAFDEKSRMGGLLRAFSVSLAMLYRRLFSVARESTAATLEDSLEDWETEFGLPDLCFGLEQSRAQRLRALRLKIQSDETVTPDEFIRLAASAGYQISIEEPMPFECGISEIGGVHELAGNSIDPGGAVEFHWIVKVGSVPVDYFECGVSEVGADRLTDFAAAEDLQCLIRNIAPAWTRPIFDYS